MALRELEASTKEIIVPFFDFPKAKEETEVRFKKTAVSRAKQIKKHLGPEFKCYLDTFDATEFVIDGFKSYAFLLNEFSSSNVICVTGLSRSQEHKDSILEVANSGKINLDSIAFRVGYEDIESFTAIKEEVDDALADLLELFDTIDLIIDLRVCSNLPEPAIVAESIDSFVKAFIGSYSTRKVIVAGSSISSVITDMCMPKTDKDFERAEVTLLKKTDS